MSPLNSIAVLLLTLTPLTFATTPPQRLPHASLAGHLKQTPAKTPDEHGWLADLSGLPSKTEVNEILAELFKVMAADERERCTRINPKLRAMLYQHFLIVQRMANHEGVYFDDAIADQWGHLLGMSLKESSGDATNVTSMSGQSIDTYSTKTNYKNWKDLLSKARAENLALNTQTNFGLLQISDNQLYIAFHLAKGDLDEIVFIEGKKGVKKHDVKRLTTERAIRHLIWFYQGFAQGRLTQSDTRIDKDKINNPAYAKRHQEGIRKALLFCGTPYLFRSRNPEHERELQPKLEEAMASIAYCELGNSKAGYGRTQPDMECFAKWVTLCPALNFDIALLLPLRYFATRNTEPVCRESFKKMLKHGKTKAQGSFYYFMPG